jgi:protein-S-isoprenylcysteine O-methyltransferase Ste14
MEPYFQTNWAAGILYLLTVLIWGGWELYQLIRQQRWRRTAVRVTARAFWPVVCGVVIIEYLALNQSPHIAQGAEIGPANLVFGVGMVILIVGIALRGWSFYVLGQYFTFAVRVSSDQRVVSTGPYHLMRHPGYTGILLEGAGVGVVYGNWLGLAVVILLDLAIVLWRIRVEENALFSALGSEYGAYAVGRKRLVPLLW